MTNFGPSPVNRVELEIKIPVSYAEFKNFILINDFKVSIFAYVITGRGTAIAKWLRRCVTNLKVAGSIPDGVIGPGVDSSARY